MGSFHRYSRIWGIKSQPWNDLSFSDPQLTHLPDWPQVNDCLLLRGMKRLQEIPETLFAGHSLILCGCPALRSLPRLTQPLQVLVLDGVGIESLPDALPFAENAELVVQNCHRLRNLPAAAGTGALAKITIRNCPRLNPLPALAASERITLTRWRGPVLETALRAPVLSLSRCPELERIQGSLKSLRLHLRNCPKLTTFTAPAEPLECLYIENAPNLTALPEELRFLGNPAEMILRGCSALTGFPDGLQALKAAPPPPRPQAPPSPPSPDWLIVEADPCPVGKVPPWNFPWRLRVRRVLLDPATVLNPEGINPLLVLTHANAEVRRILLENLGMERLETSLPHLVLDTDSDAGGQRRLIQFQVPVPVPAPRQPSSRIGAAPPRPPARNSPPRKPSWWSQSGVGKFVARLLLDAKAPPPASVPEAVPPAPPAPAMSPSQNSRAAHFLDCRCPSTGRRYLLPVPLTVRSCHAAAAWMAGFERADDYAPLLET